MIRPLRVLLAVVFVASVVSLADAATAWTKRSGDLQNTGNAGSDPLLDEYNLKHLKVVRLHATEGYVNATPIVTDGLVITGDWAGKVYVFDDTTGKRLIKFDTGTGGTPETGLQGELGSYIGMQATPVVGRVTVPDGAGGTREEKRAYIGVNHASHTLWCLNLSRIITDRARLADNDGAAYLCTGWHDAKGYPARSLGFDSKNGTLNSSPILSENQRIDHDQNPATPNVVRDVLYVASTGLDCADGRFYAMDAYSGQLYWSFDPVVNGDGQGGTIWTTPAMNRARTLLYLTTGDCVGQPQAGEMAESLVALNATNGKYEWHHQRRLVDTADLDIGNGPLVADVADAIDECHVVVSSDKDGCIYAFNQKRDIPEVGDVDFDPLRQGQQRLLWRKCFVPGSLNGGFNASNMVLEGRIAAQQTSGYPVGHVGADNANAFAVDVCSGRPMWASPTISNGRTDGAIANGFLFQAGGTRRPQTQNWIPYDVVQEVQVLPMQVEPNQSVPDVFATVDLPAQPSLGGGGIAIANGRIYVPTLKGVAVIAVVPQSFASCPILHEEQLVYGGPYPHPMSPGPGIVDPVDPDHPYPLMVDKSADAILEYKSLPRVYGAPCGVPH